MQRYSIALFIFLFLLPGVLFSQIRQLSFQQNEIPAQCSMFKLGNDSLTAVYAAYDNTTLVLYSRVSSNGGTSWSPRSVIDTILYHNLYDSIPQMPCIRLANGTFLLVYKGMDSYLKLRTSLNGINWSEKLSLPTLGSTGIARYRNTNLSLTTASSSLIFLTHSTAMHGIYILRSSDAGATWTQPQQIGWNQSNEPGIIPKTQDNLLLFYRDTLQGKTCLFQKTSTDGGLHWADSSLIVAAPFAITNCKPVLNNDGSIMVYYQTKKGARFPGFFNDDIYAVTSTDFGLSWSAPKAITRYVGYDGKFTISKTSGATIVVFQSERFNKTGNRDYYFGEINESFDASPPPCFYFYKTALISDYPFRVKIAAGLDWTTAPSIVRLIFGNQSFRDSVTMSDEGTNGDTTANDYIYTATVTLPDTVYRFDFNCVVTTNLNQYVTFQQSNFVLPSLPAAPSYRVFINRFNLPISNAGVLAAVNPGDPGGAGGKYDNKVILFSGGFMLSGYTGSTMWSNGVMSASLVTDYTAGKIGTLPSEPQNGVYVVEAIDAPFGASWQAWRIAVQQGARFYDGNGDGKYNPVDLNTNGIWDTNEDRPDLLGDITAWCVYNDGLPAAQRRWNTVNPQNIEIKQSVFGSAPANAAFGSSLFIRYSIENKNPNSGKMDSVLFAFWADPDVGDHIDDLPACDTLANAYIVYNKTPDAQYGIQCPALFGKIVQGPPVYLPGKTFQDINSNGVYDPGIDIALDTAYNMMGRFLGAVKYPGAANARVSAAMINRNGDPTFSDPNNATEARNYMKGSDRTGNLVNPCTLGYGQVVGVNCNQVNKRILFSGNPVTNTGWICTSPNDVRNLITVGPFTLERGKPVDIITAYIIGRGTTPLASITVGRNYATEIDNVYKANFINMPVSAEPEALEKSPQGWRLSDNYPNPFNPVTTIRYSLPERSRVRLSVYDILGRQVKTLVQEEKEAGEYSVLFNATSLPSGIYIYKLQAGNTIITKKCCMLK